MVGWVPVAGRVMLRKDGVSAVGGWDESRNFAEDLELWLRLSADEEFVLVPETTLWYRIHDGQQRPAGAGIELRDIRKQALARLAGNERKTAERLYRAGRLIGQALYGRTNLVRDAFLCLKATWIAPSILWSPVTAGLVVYPMKRHFTRTARRLHGRLRGKRRLAEEVRTKERSST